MSREFFSSARIVIKNIFNSEILITLFRLSYLISQNLQSPEPFRSKKYFKFHANKEKSQPKHIKSICTFIIS